MADEVIKLIEYITENPIVQKAFTAYAIFAAIVVLMAISIFIVTIRAISNNRKRWK